MNKIDNIMEQYRSQKSSFLQIETIVVEKLQAIVNESKLSISSIEHRIKEENSLHGKLLLKGDKYDSLEDITDILGLRIICFFSKDVDIIKEYIEKAFVIDWKNSVDKRALLNPESFGYLSLHYICSLPEDEGYDTNLCSKRFEIQIRSILQHTWAAIYHDLGYKTEFGIPREYIRDFSRIAGLLELADKEFGEIREALSNYEQNMATSLQTLDTPPININVISLQEWAKNSTLAKEMNIKLDYTDFQDCIQDLKCIQIETLSSLESSIQSTHDTLVSYISYYKEKEELEEINLNTFVLLLAQILLLDQDLDKKELSSKLLPLVENEKVAKKMSKRFLSFKETQQ